MYFDDISATLIPEPSALALTGLGLACLVGRRRRK
ncbi:MAG: PEP-CTERM sorting domain-containing protein [Luteolibacter sp.]